MAILLKRFWMAVAAFMVLTVAACGGDSSPISLKHKQIGLGGMMSGSNFALVTDTQAELWANINKIQSKYDNPTVQSLVGQWQVVWGPVITIQYKAATSASPQKGWTTENVMYVAKGSDPTTGDPVYKVAVGATNPTSDFDWLENLSVFTTEAWIPVGPLQSGGVQPTSIGRISSGNMLALMSSMAMRDPTTNKTLLEFAASLPSNQKAEFAFTGISLAGGLSPLIALRFQENMKAQGLNHIVTSVWPLAGPAVGDANFARYAAAQFGDRYHSMMNLFDMVPHVWQQDMMAQIPTLYTDPVFQNQVQPAPPNFLQALSIAQSKTINHNYSRIAPNLEYRFKGQPMPAQPTANPPVVAPFPYFQEAYHQHVMAYFIDGMGYSAADVAAFFKILR